MAVANRVVDSRGNGGINGGGRDFWLIEPMPKGLIDSPLDFVFAEHHRQREASFILSMVADGEFNRAGVEGLIDFLTTDFAMHVGDEESVLFPALKSYCQPDDHVERIIDRLVAEHREYETNCAQALAILRKRLDAAELTTSESRKLRRFSDHIRQHLALENGVLLPIARVRLDAHALKGIAENLKRRRGRA